MIEGVPVLDFGPHALLGLVVLLVLTDRLVWHKRLEKLEAQLEAKDKTILGLTEQNTLLLNSAVPTVDAVLGALHKAANEGGP